LKNCQVTDVAMESTGQYWRPLWNVLEGEFPQLILVNPQHIKGLNGYKTDPKDALWIAGLLEGGKLRNSWMPPRPIRELRDLTRQRVNVLEDLNRAKNRIEQLCQAGNIKVSSVATDLFGVSGRRMLKAIVERKRDPGWMADYARGTLRGKRRDLERALEGTFTDDQRWLLDKELRQVEWLEAQVVTLEQEIERRVAPFEEQIRTRVHMLTNGRSFAWPPLARTLAAVRHMGLSLGIPLYSDYAPDHDHIVQARGAFDQTILGLHQLARWRVPCEIRVVLHKLSVERLPNLAEYIVRNLPFTYHVALMGLEPTGYTPRNQDQLWIDPTEYQEQLEEAIATLVFGGMDASIYNSPLCLLKPALWRYARRSISDWKNVYLSECARCGVLERCGGLFQSSERMHSPHLRALPSDFGHRNDLQLKELNV
jgi:His-Xaa-Ser system radical SAM maturase HxsC